MAIDTPAAIAILGAGPIGLEAALYARFLGYDVEIYERGQVLENLLRWGHVPLFTPWRMNHTPLGLAALAAQDPDWRPPADDDLLTGRELAERYLLPLARSDLLVDHIHEQTEVLAVGREGLLKHDLVGDEERGERPFRLLLRDAAGGLRSASADAVIDATGTFATHNWLGQGGIPAIGEQAFADRIEYGLPDFSSQIERYAGRRVLVIGSGYSAATNIVALAALDPPPRITWITRSPEEASKDSPIVRMADDRLPQRDALARDANRLARKSDAAVEHRPGTLVEAIRTKDDDKETLRVTLVGEHPGEIKVDRIVASVGFRPDHRLYEELQVQICYASDGPMKLAASLATAPDADCLEQQSHGVASLITPEPDFYILGAKSYGRNSQFLLSIGHQQIRDLFTLIGDRENLDLYANLARARSSGA
jgi:thioredoxin reductase